MFVVILERCVGVGYTDDVQVYEDAGRAFGHRFGSLCSRVRLQVCVV